jgi:hypothetical protein
LLQSGIYVLNIQRCPGVPCHTSQDINTKLDIEISIGDTKYSNETIGEWYIDVLDTNGYTYKKPKNLPTSGTISQRDLGNLPYTEPDLETMRIYTPIVLIVE